MKEKLKNKKVVYTIIGIVSVLLVALAVTYAYWLVTKNQTGENEITAGCLDITISGEKNDIELTNQFPMSDEDGMKLVPYEFTVTNNCNTSVDYQVALEATGDSSNALKGTSLKVALNDSYKLYSAYPNVETTIEGAYESRVLGYSKLAGAGSEGSSDTYSLRIWIDADAPISEMSKTFKSRISVTIGQGIESGFEEGTLAYSILSNLGGINAIDELKPINYHVVYSKGTKSGSKTANYYYGTEYSYDKASGQYSLAGTLTAAKFDECRDGTKVCGKYTLRSTSETATASEIYEITNFRETGNVVEVNVIKYLNPFEDLSYSLTKFDGIYKTKDDIGDSYYYRGNVTNNYVQFGSYAEDTTLTAYDKTLEIAGGTPMYWRIVRINGDGTIRMIYDGVEKIANGTAHYSIIGVDSYNTIYDNSKHVGYTYDDGAGTQVDSTIKGVVDAWYDKHLEATYGTYIADGIFCNDRSSRIEGENIYYGAYDRLIGGKTPTLKCANKNDRYTVNDTINGNGLLSNPAGLITIDEVVFASPDYETDTTNYMYEQNYWTMSPRNFDVIHFDGFEESSAYAFRGTSSMYLSAPSSVRPVINLKADVEFTGDGSFETPYKIVTD